jgi:uncharacterized protein
MIDLLETSDGVVVCVRAQPRARANAIRGEQAGALKVSVTQAAEKGKANRAILDLLARHRELRLAKARPTMRADARTAAVNAKKRPKS